MVYSDGGAQMILIWLIGILLIAGILAWLAAGWSEQLSRWISLIAIGLDFVLAANIWIGRASRGTTLWLDELDWNWMPSFGIHFHLALDGLSLLMLMLTFFLGIVSVLASWTEIREKVGFFHFNLMRPSELCQFSPAPSATPTIWKTTAASFGDGR